MSRLVLRIMAGAVLLLSMGVSAADPFAALAARAEAEFPGRLWVLRSLDDAVARGLPADALRELRDADSRLFAGAGFRGVIAPFRRHWFDDVRCAIYVPGSGHADADLWTLAHEIGHCVARLNGWLPSLWTDRDVVVRHRSESWADAFAARVLGAAHLHGPAAFALERRRRAGNDAAYFTDKAIRCALQPEHAPARSLADHGREVENLLQPACLTPAAQLRATDAFLGSVQ